MATSPDALAMNDAAPAPGSLALAIADVPMGAPAGAGGAAPAAPAMMPWEREAAAAVAPRAGAGGTGVAGAGGGGDVDMRQFALDAAKADAVRVDQLRSLDADINAVRAKQGLAPMVFDESGQKTGYAELKAAPTGPAQIDPSLRLTLPTARGSAGSTGAGGFAPSAELMAEYNRKSGPIGFSKASWATQGKSVQGELGPDAEIKNENYRRLTNVAYQEALKQGKAAGTLEGNIYAAEESLKANEALRQDTQKRIDEDLNEVRRIGKEAEEGKVDPGNFWAKQGTWGQLAGALSIALGAIGAAMMKSDKNLALDIINRSIDQDINAQVENLANKRKSVGDAERRFELNVRRMGSLSTAIEHEKLQKLELVKAKLLRDDALAEAGNPNSPDPEALGITMSRLEAQIAAQEMKFSAAYNGTATTTSKWNPGGPVYGAGGKPLTFEQRQSLRKEMRDERGQWNDLRRTDAQNAKDLAEAAPQGAVVNGQDVELPGYGKEEGAKARKAIVATDQLETLVKKRDELNTLGTRLSPEQTADLKRTNEAIGAHVSTIREMGVQGETERQNWNDISDAYIGGKGTSKALLDEAKAIKGSILRQGKAQVRNADGSATRLK
jgi:hypothetical protein